MTYKIGTRVKKVRLNNAGNTGIVCDRPESHLALSGVYKPEQCEEK